MPDGNLSRMVRLATYDPALVEWVRNAALTMFDPQIAEEAGLSIPQVRNIRRKHGIPAHVSPDLWSPERDAVLTELYVRQGMAAKDAAKVMGVTEAAVRARAKKLEAKRDPAARSANVRPPPPPKRVRLVPKAADNDPPPRANAFKALEGTQPRPFLDRDAGGCRWPIDHESGPHCCNEPIGEGHPSYCAAHRRLSSGCPTRRVRVRAYSEKSQGIYLHLQQLNGLEDRPRTRENQSDAGSVPTLARILT